MPSGCAQRLIVFTRYPEPGTTKTRMIPELGAEGAADLQNQMTKQIISRLKACDELQSVKMEVRFEGGNSDLMEQWLGSGIHYRHQGQGDIGQRMERALAEGFQGGSQSAVIIGSDIPDVTCDIIQMAFDELKNHDLTLGPAKDGGYYLIGLNQNAFNQRNQQLFSAIDWSTSRVLAQTLAIAKKLGISYTLLDTLADVDRPEDLAVWYQAKGQTSVQSNSSKRLSIIIPTLNEAQVIKRTISDLTKNRRVEIIVVDGGSQDNTVQLTQSRGICVITSAPSKAKQMNVGAAAAKGDVLLFLHADTRLPDKFADKVLSAAAQNGFCAGAFKLRINSDAPGLRFIERVANWRSRFLQMPYGDQGIFVGHDLFHEIGGFPEIPIMEDYEFIRRVRRKGKITILPEAVLTSPRRWLHFGIFKTWILNQIIIGAYYLGISPHRLSHWYAREKGKSKR